MQATSQFLTCLIAALISGVGWIALVWRWPFGQHVRILTLFVFAGLAILTARTAIQSSFYNYDDANELLVYAHSAPGDKIALRQIEEISRRTTDGLAIVVAYDDEMTYPYWWYLRNYPNKQFYGANPSRDLRDVPVIVVGDANYGKIEPVVAKRYYKFDYNRIWWPYQDYFNLTWDRIRNAILNPGMRSAVFQIWLNRDYTRICASSQQPDSAWPTGTRRHMRLYIRKDVAAQDLWNYGVGSRARKPAAMRPLRGKQRS